MTVEDRGTPPGGDAGAEFARAGALARGRRGAIATPHTLATKAGLDALRGGGTAIDAALAAAAMLTVVYPHQCSIGGDAFALAAFADGSVIAVNGSGRAPAGLDAELVTRHHAEMPLVGPLTVTVPGVLGAWTELDRLGGRLGRQLALRPAITAARDGALVSRSLRAALELDAGALLRAPGFAPVFFRGDEPLSEGEVFRQPALARTLQILAADGFGAFYGGELGRRFVRGLRELGSPLDPDDLVAHETTLADPLTGRYHGTEVLTTPPNSQGFALLEILAALDAESEPLDPTRPAAPAVARLFRRVGLDRDRYLADGPVPLAELLGARHVAVLRAAMATDRPVASHAVARPLGRDTVAIAAADHEGTAVVLIQSIFHSFGARILDESTGIIVQNRGAAFSLDPVSPSVLAPRRRPPHTLMPVMVRRGGRIAFISGTMGGKAQPQIQAQLLGRLIDRGEDPGSAVTAPRWVLGGLDLSQHEGGVRLEGRLAAQRDRFERDGFETEMLDDFDEEAGHAQVVSVGASGFEAAADPRSDGAAAAW